MNTKGKIISIILSLLFIAAGLYIYYLLNNIPDFFYTQLSSRGIILMLYSLIIIGCIALTFNFIYFQLDQQIVYVEKSNKNTNEIIQRDNKETDIRKKETIVILQKEIQNIISTNYSIDKKTDRILSLLCNQLEACQGIIYKKSSKKENSSLVAYATYAYVPSENKSLEYQLGEGLVGVSAKEDRKVIITNIPEGYINVISGLGKSHPTHIAIYPLKYNNIITGILELALFTNPENNSNELLEEIITDLGKLVA